MTQSNDKELVDALKSLIGLCENQADFRNGNTHDGHDEGVVLANGVIEKAAKAALQALKPYRGSGWLPIDTIPENEYVLIYIGDGNIISSQLLQEVTVNQSQEMMDGATHWQPLPHPPESGAS